MTIAACVTLFAADETTVVVRTNSHNLPPGTTIVVDVTAIYVVDELKRDGQRIEATQVSEMRANNYLQWRLMAGPDGTVPRKEFRFVFPNKLPIPPPGTVGSLRFRTHYEIVCPRSAGKACISYQHDSTFGGMLRSVPNLIERCLNLTGLGAPEGIQTGIGSCAQQRDEMTVPRGAPPH
jgi:hypothetical protein